MLGDQNLYVVGASSFLQFGLKFRLVYQNRFRTITTRESAIVLRNCYRILNTVFCVSFFSHTMSLYIDMKMILSLSCSGSHCTSSIIF